MLGVRSESNGRNGKRVGEGEGTDAGCGEVARLCLTLVTMGHFLGQARPVHVGLVPVS